MHAKNEVSIEIYIVKTDHFRMWINHQRQIASDGDKLDHYPECKLAVCVAVYQMKCDLFKCMY